MYDDQVRNPGRKWPLVLFAWLSILLVSELPDIICITLSWAILDWLPLAKVAYLVIFLALCTLWKEISPLRPFAVVMLVMFMALAVSEWVQTSSWWNRFLSGRESSFTLTWGGPFSLDLGVALAVLAALWMVKRRRSEFFLTQGELHAPIEPVPWLGIGPGQSWKQFGWIIAVVAALAVAVPTLLALKPSTAVFLRAVPMIPTVMLFAAINAFTEEIYFRSSLLSTLTRLIGKNHTLLLNAVFFGMAHYLYGSPPGLVGFLMTGFLGWLLGKCMLETKGFLWPWFIHFLPDVVIFFSYAIGWVQPS